MMLIDNFLSTRAIRNLTGDPRLPVVISVKAITSGKLCDFRREGSSEVAQPLAQTPAGVSTSRMSIAILHACLSSHDPAVCLPRNRNNSILQVSGTGGEYSLAFYTQLQGDFNQDIPVVDAPSLDSILNDVS